MDERTGRIYTDEQMAAIAALRGLESLDGLPSGFSRIVPTDQQMSRNPHRVNEKCPCGSGKQFKNCCHRG